MVRVIIKGGVWKNTEDEILKAAIMKYGKNQWSRIASLLHRKSAKQCKARWYEWLDPRIKKTEWSREEDEKLLHLAKIMPTQWRTIAPIVGRTASQCLERYEHLLDEAQRRAEGIEEADTLKEAKKLRPGEVDPTPETKPARPDPIDMDEDELEMLSEARARLANTQGKKAKRKAREKQLSEARRLASLQKRRELRAAGIMASANNFRFKRRNDIDLNSEIPFEKHVPAGFHDPSEDRFDKNAIEKTADQRRDQREWAERQKDKDKLKKRKAEDNPESIFAAKHEKKRSKMVLPEPQISDKDLEDIVKIGHVTDSIRELVDTNPTSTLLTDYTESVRKTPAARTLRTPAFAVDAVAKAADDLLALTNVETPLKGGINTPLHTLDFAAPGSTRQVVATPNTVLAAVAATPRSIVEQTPGSIASSTPSGTPFRDQLNINQEPIGANLDDLRKQLRTLPKPKNDFEIVLPEEETALDESTEEWVEDAAELDERRIQLLAKKREQELKKRTHVVQRNLPIPSKPNEQYKKRSAVQSDLAKADDMIKAEMYALMEWDIYDKKPAEEFSQEQLKAAEELISQESPSGETLNANMVQVINTCASELILHADRFTRLSNLNKKEQIEALSSQFRLYHDWMTQNSKKTGKLEKKVKIKLGGYQAITANLLTKIEQVRNEKNTHLIELDTFSKLEQHENVSIQHRFQKLVNEVKSQEEREKELQKRYAELAHRKWELEEMANRIDATISAEPVNYNG